MAVATQLLCSPPLMGNVLHHTMTGKLSSYDMGLGSIPFNIVDVFNLKHANWEAMFVSRAFRSAIGKLEDRSTRLFGLVDPDQERALLMYEVNSQDAGTLPVVYGSSDIFPLSLPTILEYNKTFIESSGKIQVVDHGHEEAMLYDLQNYKIPSRVSRHYKKSKDLLTLTRISSTSDLMDLYKYTPYAQDVDIQSNLYYGGLIEDSMDDYDLQNLEAIYKYFHNPNDYIKTLEAIYTTDMPSNDKPQEFVLYAVRYKGWYLGSVYLQIKGKDWYWVNTNRLRIKSLTSDFDFNINDAILTNLIEEAKLLGAETFNLGYAYYDYKDFYKPERIWQKGLRWA